MSIEAIARLRGVAKRYRLGRTHASLRDAASGVFERLRQGRKGDSSPHLWALKGIDLELLRGRSLGLIGPNGGGKTTALRILAGITPPTEGAVETRGRVAAMIQLGTGFHPDLTGRENVFLYGAILGLSAAEIRSKFDRIVDFSGLARFLDTPLKRYSSGMYVRLGFSVAAHVEPDLLLIDEVLAVGDASFRQRCAERIAELKERDTSIVFVSHNLHLVQSVCDEAAFLDQGEIRAHGPVDDVVLAYRRWLRDADRPRAPVDDDALPGERSGLLDILDVEVESSAESTERGWIAGSDSVIFRVYYRARGPIARPNFVLRILTSDGTVACALWTRDDPRWEATLEGSGGVAICVDPIQLAGGIYSVEARLEGEIKGLSLALGYSGRFEVRGVDGHDSEGAFVPRMAWVRNEPAAGR